MNFPKFADIRTEKKVTPKDPLRINARDLKKVAYLKKKSSIDFLWHLDTLLCYAWIFKLLAFLKISCE